MRTSKNGSTDATKTTKDIPQPPLFLPNGPDSSTDGSGLKPPFDDLGALQSPEEPERPPSVFDDLDALKIGLDDDDDVSEDVLTTVPIRRPGKKFFRAHPNEAYQFNAAIVEDAESKTTYYVMPDIARLVRKDEHDIKRVVLALCINRVGVMFFWPIPGTGGFYDSGLNAIRLARQNWLKATGDLTLGGYRTRVARVDFGPPAWPETMPALNQLLELAFHNNIIRSLEHPALCEQ